MEKLFSKIPYVFLLMTLLVVIDTSIRFFIEVNGLIIIRPFSLPFMPDKSIIFNIFSITVLLLFKRALFYFIVIALYLILRGSSFTKSIVNQIITFNVIFLAASTVLLFFNGDLIKSNVQEMIFVSLISSVIIVGISVQLFDKKKEHNGDIKT